MLRSKRILVLITHSLGELDSLFPFFAGLKSKYDIEVDMLITVKKIYRQYESNDFYKFCAKELDIKITMFQLPNKFDYRDGFFIKKTGIILIRMYFIILKIIKYPILIPKLVWSDAYMHEFSIQIGSTYMLYLWQRLFSKRIYTYIHGQSFNQVGKIPIKIPLADKSTLLLWHENNRPLVNSVGYSNVYLIGMTKFYSEWIYYINQYSKSKFNCNKIVVIYTREAGHKYYMEKDIYLDLLLTSYRVIRQKMGDIIIVVKPHPRENTEFLKNLILENKLENIVISNEHAAVLAKSAILTISLWTGCVFDSLSLDVPTVEFYKESKNFRIIEPEGSMFKKYDINSVDNEYDLTKFVESVMNSSYTIPKIINDLKKMKNLDFFNAI